MITDLKPYAEYKDSGLPWLGQVPGHWTTRVLKRLCTRSALYGANIPAANYVSAGVRFLRTTDITDEGTLRRGGVFVGEDSCHDYMLVDGDILVSRSGTIGRSLRYRAEVHGPCAYAGYLVRFVPKPIISADYLFHFTKSLAFADFIRVSAVSSTIENVNGDKYANMPIPLPPPSEQAAIVRFLDWANGRLERAIRAKRKVIALLNEQKQAIIHRAVTRGLDPSVPLKDSGVQWLGEIPAHWEVRRAKYLFVEVDDRSKEGKETHLAMSQRLGLVPSGMVNSAMRSESYAGAKLCEEGDLVLNRLKAHLGVFALANQGGVISPDYSVFRKRAAISMQYYESVLKSSACRRELRIRAKGLVEGFWRLYTDDFYDIRLPVPPVLEQYEIMSAMSVQTAGLDTAISRLEREITLLREYRTRLVADVVTGKLDVREAAAALPEEEPLAEVTDLPDLDDEMLENEDSNDSEMQE